jgi:hypothetical protein
MATTSLTPAAPPQPPRQAPAEPPIIRRGSRRYFFKYLAAAIVAPVAGGAYAREVEPYWVDYHDVPMPMRRLDRALAGLRVAHLTDLHAGHEVPFSFLQAVAAKVRDARPDLVVVTGDLITNARQDWFARVADLLAGLGCPTFVSFGNHDYGIYRPQPDGPQGAGRYRWSADVLERLLSDQGVNVLRNRAVRISPRGAPLWIVGLDDMWGGYFRPGRAFANLPADQPVICLSHNPDTGPDLLPFQPDCILAGHTHGGQVRLPFVGAPILPVHHKQFDCGMFRLGPCTHLYVSRGVGYLRQVRLLCRPELPTYVLAPEKQSQPPSETGA